MAECKVIYFSEASPGIMGVNYASAYCETHGFNIGPVRYARNSESPCPIGTIEQAIGGLSRQIAELRALIREDGEVS